jgi:glycosyltransferase involved in cell wall biosynthesis
MSETLGRRWPFSVSVVIPALNEGATIGGVIERTRAIVPDAEVLVVDDCSSDDTAARAEAAGAGVIRRPYTPESWLTVGPARE